MNIILLIIFISLSAMASEACKEQLDLQTEKVEYVVNSKIPNHLKGAVIIVRKANGEESKVPAEKFMVVPRKQKTVLGENVKEKKTVLCSEKSKKNLFFVDAKREITDLDVSTSSGLNSSSAKVSAKKELVPSVNLYRRDVFDSPFGLGVGLDTNGSVKGMVGIDF
jgi:hypothetical protein